MSEAFGETSLTYPNVDLFREALEKAFNTNIQILECSIKLASTNGENFCSNIYRAHVKFQTGNSNKVHEKALIMKDMIAEIAELGSNEYDMYEKILPVMEETLSSGLEKPIKLKPDCLISNRTEKEFYILEDLNDLGYRPENRCLGLDEEHAMLLLKKIAQFHAASIIFTTKFPTVVAALDEPHFAEGAADPLANAITFGGIKHAVSIVEKWSDFDEIAKKMLLSINNFDERVKKLVDHKNSKINVINHGDLWVNNFLYSYKDNKPHDVVFVDFQNCFLGSPGFDLNHFLYTSVQLEVLKSKRYDLLRCYYTALKYTLKKCNFTALIPTWQTIMEEVRNCEFIGYYATVCELPICCMSKEVSKGFTAATFTDPLAMLAKRELMYNNERVLATLRFGLDHFNELGVLD